MEQNEFEKNIRKALEKRTIAPSEIAWSKLETNLDTMPKKNNLKTYYWIAASIFILIAISIMVNIKNETMSKVVEISKENKIQENNTHLKPKAIIENKITIVESSENEKELINKASISEKNNKIVEIKNKIVDQKDLESKALKPIERIEDQAIAFEAKKVNETVEIIQTIKSEREVTEEEIDLLLAQAQREIDSQKLTYNKSVEQIDPMALLQDVEGELDNSFKDKVLDLLKKKIIEVVVNTEN